MPSIFDESKYPENWRKEIEETRHAREVAAERVKEREKLARELEKQNKREWKTGEAWRP